MESAPQELLAPSVKSMVAPTLANESLAFSNVDRAIDSRGIETTIEAPKTIERLEQIAADSAVKRDKEKLEEDDQLEGGDTLKIGDDVTLEISDVNDLNRSITVIPPVLEGIEIIPST